MTIEMTIEMRARVRLAPAAHTDHDVLLATIEDALGVPQPGNAAHAPPRAESFVP